MVGTVIAENGEWGMANVVGRNRYTELGILESGKDVRVRGHGSKLSVEHSLPKKFPVHTSWEPCLQREGGVEEDEPQGYIHNHQGPPLGVISQRGDKSKRKSPSTTAMPMPASRREGHLP